MPAGFLRNVISADSGLIERFLSACNPARSCLENRLLQVVEFAHCIIGSFG